LANEFKSHERLHTLGEERWTHYKHLAQMNFKDIHGN
jgi:hypothetical protein